MTRSELQEFLLNVSEKLNEIIEDDSAELFTFQRQFLFELNEQILEAIEEVGL